MALKYDNVSVPISLPFTLSLVGLVVAAVSFVAGVSTASVFSEFLLTVLAGAILAVAYSYALVSLFDSHRPAMIVSSLLGGFIGLAVGSAGGALFGVIFGLIAARLVFWVHYREYRRGLPAYLTSNQVLWHYGFRAICGAIFIFLITPILVVMPLSFNAQDFFTFTPEMLRFDPEGYSLKHYRDFFTNNEWQRSFKNSLIIAPFATAISVSVISAVIDSVDNVIGIIGLFFGRIRRLGRHFLDHVHLRQRVVVVELVFSHLEKICID